MCSIFQCFETNPKKPHDLVEATVSLSFSADLKNFSVRLVHPGRKEELFHYAVSASHVMQKYPGMCIATPEVFKRPHVSVLSAEDVLSPGDKYYLIPKTTVRKLKLKWLQKKKEKRLTRVDEESNSKPAEISDTSGDISMDSVGSAKEFYYKRCDYEKESGMKRKKKPFVPPINKPRTRKGFEWEPGLPSIEEVSP
ncbi:hypothetical protein LIER_02049 [Lithospermum erythrorhizon]|uniref:Uncharacterized protein n=1 Tax=Lithospermum erythrorhizon TaxID=34254 RepID=A0AAV3NPK3_LITER